MFVSWLIMTCLLAAWLIVDEAKKNKGEFREMWVEAVTVSFIASGIICGMFLGVYWVANTFTHAFMIVAGGGFAIAITWKLIQKIRNKK